MSRPLLSALCLSAPVISAPAGAEEDGQAWAAVTASGAVRGDLFLWLEAQARGTDAGSGSQILLRPAVGVRIGRDAHAVAGYAYVRTDPAGGRTTDEHRTWQQVQFVPARLRGAPLVVSRTRLEQRMIVGGGDTGWRLRQFVRVQAPLSTRSKVMAVGWTEGFFNLNATRAGARSGVDQWRTFAGVGVPVSARVRVEPGYLNQRVFRRGEDRTNHVASLSVFVGL